MVWSRRTRVWLFVCYHRAVRKLWTIPDAWKSRVLVLWLLINVLSVYSCSKIWASSNRGRSAMVYTRKGSWFSTGWSLFLLAFNSEAFCVFFPLWKHDYLLNDCVGCRSKVLGASSVEWCCICGIGNFNLSLLCITKISDRYLYR